VEIFAQHSASLSRLRRNPWPLDLMMFFFGISSLQKKKKNQLLGKVEIS
jgi:hypothetical protein